MKAKHPEINRSSFSTRQQCMSFSPDSPRVASTMVLRLLLLLLVLATTLFIAQAQGIGISATDCCLKHSQRVIPSSLVKSYSTQGPESGCILQAVVFTTKKGKKICASPTDPAIQKLIQSLDKKVKKDKKRGQSLRHRARPKRQKRQQV